MKLFSIGHSNHTNQKFISLLEDNGIMNLVDVRTMPYSRFNPQFNKENLESVLSERWIQYIYAGKYLGGRPSDPNCYKSRELPEDGAGFLHEVDYPEIMKRQWFIQGINQLLEIANEQTTAIMCSEEDPAECHRHHLIAKYLMTQYPEIEIYHIRGDGNVYRANSLHISIDKPDAKQLTLF